MTARRWLPTRIDLDAATARTAAAIADPRMSRGDVERFAELEEATHLGYLGRPGADAELQAEAELAAGLYVTKLAYAPPPRELQVLRTRPLRPAPGVEAGS
jgi:hypothetical protein